jgi:hypothetical protein
LTTWRIKYTVNAIQNRDKQTGEITDASNAKTKSIHAFIFFTGLQVITEIPVFLIMVPISCILAPYRIPKSVKSFYNSQVNNRRGIACQLFIDSIVDLPFTVMALVVIGTIIRSVPLYLNWKKHGDEYLRIVIFQQFVALLLDIPMACCMVLIGCTWYRFPMTMKKISENRQKMLTTQTTPHGDITCIVIHTTSFSMMKEILVDICHVILAIPIVVSWRLLHFVRQLKSCTNADDFERYIEYRNATTLVFYEWLMDVPYVIAGVCSLWRIPRIISLIEKNSTAKAIRSTAFEQFVKALLDVPAVLCAIVLLGTMYRFFGIFRTKIEPSSMISSYQLKIFHQFWQLVLDIPAIICGILTLWRLPYLIYKATKVDSGEKRRALAYRQLFETLIDIPFVLSVIILVLTIMHILSIIAYYSKYKRVCNEIEKNNGTDKEYGDAFWLFRKKIMYTVVQSPLHTPMIICSYLITFTGYRLMITLRMLKNAKSKKEGAKVFFLQALSILADIVALPCGLILFVTYWRAKDLITILRTSSLFVESYSYKQTLATQIEIYKTFWYLVRDIPILLLIIFSSFTIWRIGYIARLLRGESDYRKRLIALALSSLLAMLDIPCLICTLVVLCSWRSKNMINLIAVVRFT